MANTISPNMSLVIPGVGTEVGPTYAFDVNASLTLIDRHDHSLGSGVQITPAGLNINTTLDFQDNQLTSVNSIVFTEQNSVVTDVQTLSVAPGSGTGVEDLWFTDGAGNNIQITKNGIVNTVASSIPGESYSGGFFIWDQTQSGNPTTPANFDIGSIILRPNVALTTYGVTLSPPSTIASAYELFLPTDPSALSGTAFLTLNTGGEIVGSVPIALGITSSMLAPDSVITTKILDGAVTRPKLDPTIINNASLWASQSFSSSGSFVVPAHVNFVMVEACGGGGGGGGGGVDSVTAGGGGAGGNASHLISYAVPVTPSATVTVTIGGGGAGGSGSNPNGFNGGSGGDTSFGSYVWRGGGGGIGASGASGGTVSVGHWFTNYGGPGGGTATAGTAGFNSIFTGGGAGGNAVGSRGGGGGGGASRGAGGNGGNFNSGAGTAGANSGAGGGGGSAGGATHDGGAGGSGYLTVYWLPVLDY